MQLGTSQSYPRLKMRFRASYETSTSTWDTFQFTFQHTLKVPPLPFPSVSRARREDRKVRRFVDRFVLSSSFLFLFFSPPTNNQLFADRETLFLTVKTLLSLLVYVYGLVSPFPRTSTGNVSCNVMDVNGLC